MTRALHFLAGFAPAGQKVRAVCHCGEATTPRVNRARAREALEAEHGFTSPECALCGRDAAADSTIGFDEAYRRLRVVPITDPLPGEQPEFFACRDTDTCLPIARERQHEADKAAFLALGMRPNLRLIQGGAA